MKKQINVTLINMNDDTITFEDVISATTDILNFQKRYFIERFKINLNKSQLIDKDKVYEKFDSLKSIKVSIIGEETEEIEFSKNMYLYNDKPLNYVQFCTRPYSKAKV